MSLLRGGGGEAYEATMLADEGLAVSGAAPLLKCVLPAPSE